MTDRARTLLGKGRRLEVLSIIKRRTSLGLLAHTEMESAMTTHASTQPGRDTGHRGLVATIAIGLIASAAVLGLLVSGVTFLALAIAFEIAVPIAQQYHVSVSAADMAMAAVPPRPP